GCVSVGSSFDVLPRGDRVSRAPAADGEWCSVENDAPNYNVRSGSEACFSLTWERSQRAYRLHGENPDGPEKMTAQLVVGQLQSGVLLVQMDKRSIVAEPPEEQDRFKEGPTFSQSVMMVQGDVAVGIPFDGTKEQLDAIVARHPSLKVQGEGTTRTMTA